MHVSLSLCSPPSISAMANEAHPCPCDIGHRLEYGGMGQEVQVEHIKAYVTKAPFHTDKAVIVIQDIFGWQLPNTRYMADLIAGNGYTYVGSSVLFLKFLGISVLCYGPFRENKTKAKKPHLHSKLGYYFLISWWPYPPPHVQMGNVT